ncbi:MAG: hypothetical protein GXZ03_01935 [Proteiniphilum sp.]|nr:hypothetical protein [Proteiniphilum sp.]
MAVTKIRKISSWTFLTSIFISLVVIALFLFGGQAAADQKIVADLPQPAFTDIVLYWAYALLGVTIISLALFAVIGFFQNLKVNKKGALGSLLVLVAMAALLIITYTIGSGEILHIPGYEGPDNNPTTLKMTDMWIYSMYIMLILSIAAIVVSPLLARRK